MDDNIVIFFLEEEEKVLKLLVLRTTEVPGVLCKLCWEVLSRCPNFTLL